MLDDTDIGLTVVSDYLYKAYSNLPFSADISAVTLARPDLVYVWFFSMFGLVAC